MCGTGESRKHKKAGVCFSSDGWYFPGGGQQAGAPAVQPEAQHHLLCGPVRHQRTPDQRHCHHQPPDTYVFTTLFSCSGRSRWYGDSAVTSSPVWSLSVWNSNVLILLLWTSSRQLYFLMHPEHAWNNKGFETGNIMWKDLKMLITNLMHCLHLNILNPISFVPESHCHGKHKHAMHS